MADVFRNHRILWLWVPAFAGTTKLMEQGWVEPFAKPIAFKDELMGYRFVPPIRGTVGGHAPSKRTDAEQLHICVFPLASGGSERAQHLMRDDLVSRTK